MRIASALSGLAALLPAALACDGCYGPVNNVEHVRQVKRMQPGAPGAAYGPKAPLEWGQVNFLHTTDSHGWLEGHLKEKNYGADWGDFVTFSRRMKHTAGNMGVDLLLVDTGDLHDGTGLSDATDVDGTLSMPIFDEIDYDLLTIGNHELYVAEVTLQMFRDYAGKWGDRYVTSNVKVFNDDSQQFEYLGATHRYFTTEKGLRVMAFGVLFDFDGNANVSQVIKAEDMIQEQWFTDALATDPIDMFVLFGHNPVRRTEDGSTLGTVWDAIRAAHPETPIQVLGGHTHIRDFAVYDENSVGIESGRYCETLGWMSMSGFDESNSGFDGVENPHGVANPSRPAVEGSDAKASPFVYSRRYLDWNRKTFIYHSNNDADKYDYHSGSRVTDDITDVREELKLGEVYGCAPQTWCISCVPYNDTDNLFPGVIFPAMAEVVVNEDRKDKARMVIGNTGAIRFDILQGPFTFDDTFIVSPFRDVFLSIHDVKFDDAKDVINKLNSGPVDKRSLASMQIPRDECMNPSLGYMTRRDLEEPRGVTLRQETTTFGYTTVDDFGDDGDDTVHSEIPHYPLPNYWEARASFPEDGSDPELVDLIFFDFIEDYVIADLGPNYSSDMVECYIDCDFTSQDFLLPYAKLAWQENIDNCPL